MINYYLIYSYGIVFDGLDKGLQLYKEKILQNEQ